MCSARCLHTHTHRHTKHRQDKVAQELSSSAVPPAPIDIEELNKVGKHAEVRSIGGKTVRGAKSAVPRRSRGAAPCVGVPMLAWEIQGGAGRCRCGAVSTQGEGAPVSSCVGDLQKVGKHADVRQGVIDRRSHQGCRRACREVEARRQGGGFQEIVLVAGAAWQ